MTKQFNGKTVLITSANLYMGEYIRQSFEADGATVIADYGNYRDDPSEPSRVIADAGPIDILIINLSPYASFDDTSFEAAADASEAEWQKIFDSLAHPTMRFVRAVLPQMIEKKEGKIIVLTSSSALRPVNLSSSYSAARGAQNAYVKSVGAEVARHNIQINAIAQGFVYGGFPEDAMDRPQLRDAILREVPAQRLAEKWEHAELVKFLASQNSNFICGQVIPYAGGWVT